MIIHYTQSVHQKSQTLILDGDEALHCAKVLRSRVGDEIFATDGEGALYHATLEQIDKTKCTAKIKKTEILDRQPYELTIAICPTKKAARIEWFLEKAVEIGVSRVILMETQRTEKSHLKQDRLQKIIISAMKQSKNLYLPELILNESWSNIAKSAGYGEKFIAHCEDPNAHLAHICMSNTDCIVAVGPEGDFTPKEIELALNCNWKEINLGPSRLRTETAGVVVAACLAQINLVV